MQIFNETFTTLQKSLDLRMVNSRVIASNLANVDTPGFKASSLDFEASMAKALEQMQTSGADGSAIPGADALAKSALGSDDTMEPVIKPTGDAPLSLDGNNVNMETELGKLGENTMMYRLTAQLLAAKLRQIGQVLNSNQ